ncbi:MAG: hypothetical protein RQ875_03765 [Vicingaceae bacterium]|nr:hypothetical protein [Vicingaceae bacterium]
MKPLPKFILLITSIAFFTTTSCRKDNNCYEDKLYEQHKNDICTMDCPGVIGCDGKTYCNECEANRKGISVK